MALPGGSAEPGASPGASVADASPTPSGGAAETVVYREGTIGRPSSINPLTARTQADRDLVALVFSGLVALGPDGTYRPDLASGWTVDSKGKVWTFTIRPDARWQDGEPVTADDVVFTVDILKSPGYTGPLGSSWQGVNVTAVDERTVRFELDTPIGGFLQAATIGLLPAHLLSEAPVETLADDPFSVQPVGSGPFVLTSWNAESASLAPASLADTPAVDPGPLRRRPRPISPRRRPRPTPRARRDEASPVPRGGRPPSSAPGRVGRRRRPVPTDSAADHATRAGPAGYRDDVLPGCGRPGRRLPCRRPRRGVRADARARRTSSPRCPAAGS